MTFTPEMLSDPSVFAEGRLNPHSDHGWFASRREAEEGESRYLRSLNGEWKFVYAKNPGEVPEGFEQPTFDVSEWDDITVPGHIQLQGYDRPQYVNVQYPWDGHEQISPPEVPTEFNPVGVYVTTFHLGEAGEPGEVGELDEDGRAAKSTGGPVVLGVPGGRERISIRFDGAESALALWVNGEYVGYAEDSFTPSEFDITDLVVPGENRVAVQVFKWCSGSWFEDQDFFRFSGLFRDVTLRVRPHAHITNTRVSVDLVDDLSEATVRVDVDVEVDGGCADGVSVAATLVEPEWTPASPEHSEPHSSPTDASHEGGTRIPLTEVSPGRFEGTIEDPLLWSAEHPNLYGLELEIQDESGEIVEFVPLKVGARRFGVEDGLLKINGERVVFKGVNRHEFGERGRVFTREETERDLKLLKQLGVNAIRTSHYPNNSFFYDLADAYGFYVIDEMNLETHGTWDRRRVGADVVDEALPGNDPRWVPLLLDRAANMVERDKNHPSVVMWSVGNESFGGKDLLHVADYFREVDSRPVHYEGLFWDDRYPDTSDVNSRMYTPAAKVEEFLEARRDKPFILCEYAHAMGNSFGSVERYTQLAYQDPLYQGGFIWDFADQALPTEGPGGEMFYGYGGDFSEAPHDGPFCGNGIFFVDRTPTPRAAEAKYLYQGLEIDIDLADDRAGVGTGGSQDGSNQDGSSQGGAGVFTVTNRTNFTNSATYECVVTLEREGEVLAEKVVETGVEPGESATYPLPPFPQASPGEHAVTVQFRLRQPTMWADAGFEVASEQAVFDVPAVTRPHGEGETSEARGNTKASAFSAAQSVFAGLGDVGQGVLAGVGEPDQPVLEEPAPLPHAPLPAAPSPQVIDGLHNIGVRGPYFSALFSKIYGGLVGYVVGDRASGAPNLLKSIPMPNFWHAPTSNEQAWGGPGEDGQWLIASRYAKFVETPENPLLEVGEDAAAITYNYALPTAPPSEATVRYEVRGDGSVDVTVTVDPGEGLGDMPEFGMLFQVSPALDVLTWYGEGPHESQVDRRGSARLGVHREMVATALTKYLEPQESGNHTGVRWAEVTDEDGLGLRFEWVGGSHESPAGRGMEFSALPWSPFEIENAAHHHELPPITSTWVRPALMRRGVAGDDAWGARPHPEYLLPKGEKMVFRFKFRGVQ